MRRYMGRRGGFAVLLLSVSICGVPVIARADEEPRTEVVIEKTPEARRLAGEVIAQANSLYYRLFAPGSPGFEATFAVKRGADDVGRVRVRAAAAVAQADVAYDGDLPADWRSVVLNHARALVAPLTGPFLATEAEFGHPIHAVRLRDRYALDLSGAGRIPGVASSRCDVALDFSSSHEVGRLTNGSTVEMWRKGGTGREKRYLTSQSFTLARPGAPVERTDYAWAWARSGTTMFVKRFTATQAIGDQTMNWEMTLEGATFAGGAVDGGAAPTPPPVPDRAPPTEGPPRMRKFVSRSTYFTLYAPADWTMAEGATAQYWWVVMTDPASGSRAAAAHGISPTGDDVRALAGRFLRDLAGSGPDLNLVEARISPRGERLFVRGTYPGANSEFRAWFSVQGGNFTHFRVDVPAGEYDRRKQVLLSVLTNVGSMRDAFGTVAARPLATHETALPQQAATFEVPDGWKVTPLGSIYFFAQDPQAKHTFMIAYAEAITPRMGVAPPGVAVSNVRSAHDAFVFFGERSRLLSNASMLSIKPRPDVAGAFALGYTVGPVTAEEFVYTFDDAQGRRCKGFTLGLVLGSRLDINWKLIHLTATSPVADFDVMAATFYKMGSTYRVNDEYAAHYVEAGMARVREMIRETAAIVARNAAEIHSMMNAAFQERMASGDYIDFIRTGYIRGEATWVAEGEGGGLYKTDAWGAQNETTGQRWDGQPFNYYNFRGGGGYGGLTEVNRRDLYERYVRGH